MSNVKIIAHHDRKKGDLNDNHQFVNALEKYSKSVKAKFRVEEYFNNWCEVYKFKDKWGMYFTVPYSNPITNDADGYLIESVEFMALWETFAKYKKIQITDNYTMELINHTVNHFAGVSTKNL